MSWYCDVPLYLTLWCPAPASVLCCIFVSCSISKVTVRRKCILQSFEDSTLVFVLIDQQIVRGTVDRNLGVSGTTFALLASECHTAAWQASKHWKFHKLQQERHVLLLSKCFAMSDSKHYTSLTCMKWTLWVREMHPHSIFCDNFGRHLRVLIVFYCFILEWTAEEAVIKSATSP